MNTLPAAMPVPGFSTQPHLVTSLGQLIGCHTLEIGEDSQESELAMS